MADATDIVRKVVEKDGKVLVSFANRAAYYTLPPELRAAAEEAKEQGRELRFSYDADLKILTLAPSETPAKAGV